MFFSSLGVKIQPIQLIFSQDITQGFIGHIIPRRIGDLKLCPLGLRLPAGVSHQENVVLSIQKDDNIHKSEALKRYNKRTLTLVECQNGIIRI